MFGNKLINTNAGGGCTNTVDLYNPFPDGGGVALYQLNGDATDVSGNYDASTVNAITWGGAGEFGTSAAFNGSSSYIQASTSPLSGFSSTSNYSVSLWFKANSLSSASTLISGITGVNTLPPYIWVDSTKIRFHGYQIGEYTGTINTGQWYNIVMVNSGTTTKAYIDGSEVALTSLTNWNQPAGGILEIGGLQQYGEILNGSIDQVRLFNRALRPYEVEALYTEEYCTPTIVPSEHFNTVLYTGSGSDGLAVTGTGFSPDFVWIKPRTQADNHNIYDTLRGVRQQIIPNNTSAESTQPRTLQSFDADGFTLNDDNNVNNSGIDYVSWNFKAGGSAVTNTDGTITSQVSANTEAGFSIVKFTGSLTSGQTVGHGLTEPPSVVILKDLDSVANWYIYHKGTGTTSGYINYLRFDSTAGDYSDKIFYPINFNSTTFTPGNDETVLQGNVIAYCFAEVEGFSNFGSYVGTGVVGNVSVVTGFEPAMIIAKRTDAGSSNWFIWDNKRDTTNPNGTYLLPNDSNAENDLDAYGMNFLENGFTVNSSDPQLNASGGKYIYMAFAADPTTIEPSLEDSFNTVVYSGDGTSSNEITGVGFQPDFTWIKDRNADSHRLFDSIRGANNRLYSNSTSAESPTTDSLLSFDDNGFTLGSSMGVNESGTNNYVSWNWKGAELPAINSNGSIPSVVSANPAAGFSIVSYTGNSTNSTVGHGLGTTPNIVLTKRRNSTSNWSFNGNIGGLIYGTNKLALNDTNGISSDTNEVLAANSNTFTAGTSGAVGLSGGTYVAYCFAEVAGFSKFGSYTGVIASGNPINVGFEPAFILVKRYNATENWVIFDNKRGSNFLMADRSDADINATTNAPVFTSTGFYFGGVSTGWNSTGNSYIYMAFANQF